MDTEKPTPDYLQWIRWFVTIAIIVVANAATAAWWVSASSAKIDRNEQRILKLENDGVTKDQFMELKSDLKDVRTDVKELLRQRR